MADKRNEPSFTVTDRRKFTIDGEVRPDAPREEESSSAPSEPKPAESNVKEFPKRAVEAPAPAEAGEHDEEPAITAEEKRASADAYRQSSSTIDQHLAGQMKEQGRSPKDFEMTFEKLVASLYTTALMQLGLDPQSGQVKYQPDIIAARQTIDMLSILQEKTKGNLDAKETRLLDGILYELRMAYIEITKMLTQAPPPGGLGKA